MNREQAVKVLRQIADALRDTVKEAGDSGAPGGVLYAACMAHGMSFDMFQQIMAGMVEAKVLRKQGNLYFTNQ